MISKLSTNVLEQLTIRELEELLERKKRSQGLSELLRQRDQLRLELRRLDDAIDAIERSEELASPGSPGDGVDGEPETKPSFLSGRRKRNLKDYIAQVLLDAREPLSPSDIQKRLPSAGYVSASTNPRSFYNTVFQALQRYDIFEKESKKYRLSQGALKENGVKEILPKKKTRLKDYIIEVLDQSDSPLKVSEIASRVVIAGYDTELEMDELNQRVSATLKKYLNKDFDWDSQRYKLANRAN
ncbi:MAG: hypothetical protein JXA90_16715 [Planctomycetes bacterium]|nr:hypothetical protein [Planctomycetota bacterium]